MTAAELVADLKAKGISLVVNDGNLKCQGKDSALTPELLDTLREQKADLMALLASETAPPPSDPFAETKCVCPRPTWGRP